MSRSRFSQIPPESLKTLTRKQRDILIETDRREAERSFWLRAIWLVLVAGVIVVTAVAGVPVKIAIPPLW
jgi:hypothetical protein